MYRITRKVLEGQVSCVNSALRSEGSKRRISIRENYGSCSVEEMQIDDSSKMYLPTTEDVLREQVGCLRTAFTGTKRECSYYIRGMQDIHWMLIADKK